MTRLLTKSVKASDWHAPATRDTIKGHFRDSTKSQTSRQCGLRLEAERMKPDRPERIELYSQGVLICCDRLLRFPSVRSHVGHIRNK